MMKSFYTAGPTVVAIDLVTSGAQKQTSVVQLFAYNEASENATGKKN
jgi:hypothetical protein